MNGARRAARAVHRRPAEVDALFTAHVSSAIGGAVGTTDMSFTLHEGTLFAERYRIIRCIATGGMGAVYEVVHVETERRRALKVMLPHLFKSPELRERFKREARVAAQIDSEYIVDVFDAGVDPATAMPFLVMELLRGEELGARLDRVGALPPSEVVLCLHQTALALEKTHQAAIVHRDLKPENLFLVSRERGSPQIKVLDFGVAKFIADIATQAGATLSVGTPYYMSPEQFRGGAITHAADLYALGMMAYTLLVGEPYWSEEGRSSTSLFAFSSATTEGPKEPPSVRAARRNVSLSPAFDAWFRKATATDPTQRFPTAVATVDALAEALGLASLVASVAPGWPADAIARASRPSGETTGNPMGAGATTPLMEAAGRLPAEGVTRQEGHRPAAADGGASAALGAAVPLTGTGSGSSVGVELAGAGQSSVEKKKRSIPLALLLGSLGVGAALAVAMYALRGPTPPARPMHPTPSSDDAPVTARAVDPAPAPITGASAASANDAPPAGRPAVLVEPAASGNLASPPVQASATASAPGKGLPRPGPGAPAPSPVRPATEPIYTRD